MFDGFDAVEAAYRWAGELGWTPRDMAGVGLQELWPMYCGRMQARRQHTLWQTQILLREKLDASAFLRRGYVGDPKSRQVVMSDDMAERVAVYQGCWNRGLPEPDFTDPDWQEKIDEAFREHDAKVIAKE